MVLVCGDVHVKKEWLSSFYWADYGRLGDVLSCQPIMESKCDSQGQLHSLWWTPANAVTANQKAWFSINIVETPILADRLHLGIGSQVESSILKAKPQRWAVVLFKADDQWSVDKVTKWKYRGLEFLSQNRLEKKLRQNELSWLNQSVSRNTKI